MKNDSHTSNENCTCKSYHKSVWQHAREIWFEDVPKEDQISFGGRRFISTSVVIVFILLYISFDTRPIVEPLGLSTLFPLVFAIFAVVGIFLGFLLAWKRPQSGPVRLFLSGVTLPAHILFLVRFSGLIGIG